MLDCLFELSLFLTQPANGNKLTKLNSLADNQADHHIGDFHFSIFSGDRYLWYWHFACGSCIEFSLPKWSPVYFSNDKCAWAVLLQCTSTSKYRINKHFMADDKNWRSQINVINPFYRYCTFLKRKISKKVSISPVMNFRWKSNPIQNPQYAHMREICCERAHTHF